jgi:osmoprotectant transport system permease protein
MDKQETGFFLPIAGIVWFVVGVLLFLLSSVSFSLNDTEIWPDLVPTIVETEDQAENKILLDIEGGGFFYSGSLERFEDTDTSTFYAPLDEVAIIENIDSTELNRVIFLMNSDIDAPEFAESLSDVESSTITEVNAGIVTLNAESDAAFRDEFGPIRQIEQIIDRGGNERIVIFSERANLEAFSGRINDFKDVSGIELITLSRIVVAMPDTVELDSWVDQYVDAEGVEDLVTEPLSRLLVDYREGANPDRVISRVEDRLNDFFPIATLNMSLWLPTLQGSPDTVIEIRAADTPLPLYAFAFLFGIIEIVLAFYFRTRDDKLLQPLIRAAGVFLLFWSIFGHEPFWDFILGGLFPSNVQFTSVSSSSRVVNFVGQHMELVIISSLATIPTGVLLGIFVTREETREFLPLVNNVVNSAQTVPTLAIVAIMAPLIEGEFWPAIVALFLYGLLPVVRNTIVGLEAVDSSIIDAAKGMGMTKLQILLQIELPIASNIIMAGIRTSMVVNVGTATLGAFIGAGGLGFPIQSGISMVNYPFVFLGALPAALLAILIDYVLGRIEFVITPRGLQIER